MITPDPVDNTSAVGFSNLIVLKAACMIARSEVKKLNSQGAGWKIIDDRSTIDGTKVLDVVKEAATSICSAYGDTLLEFKEGNKGAGLAVLAPYSSPNYNRSWYIYPYRNGNY